MTGEAGSAPTDLLEDEAKLAEPKPFRKGDPGIDPPGKGTDGAGRGGYVFIRNVRQAGPGGKVRDTTIPVTSRK